MPDSIRMGEGARLGRYQILRRIGAGAMGEVYLADDPQIGRRLALKTVRVEEGRLEEVEDRKRRLLREARAAGKLLHPNIVTLFDAGEDQGMLYLAFEFVEGSDLAHRVAAGPALSLAEALSIVRQAAEALDYAHRQGVIHRDIKPSNLMLTDDGRVKVADFGIAKVLDQTSDLTMTGSVVGSPHYLSPEQIRGDELDGRTDVFSLGVLFYEILCRKKPFEADTLTTLVYRILNQEPTPVLVRRPDLGSRLEKLVQKMLAKDRELRYSSAAEVAAELALCERELSPTQLAGRARPDDAPTEATRLLPPEPRESVSGPSSAPGSAVAPPPLSEPVPPPPPAPPSIAPPPPPPMVMAPPVAPPPIAPATDSTAFSPPSPQRSRLIGVAIAGLAVLLLLVFAGLRARNWLASKSAREATVASTPATSPASPAATTTEPSSKTDPPAAPAPAAAELVPPPASEAPAAQPSGNELPFQPGERQAQVTPPPASTTIVPISPAPAPSVSQSSVPSSAPPSSAESSAPLVGSTPKREPVRPAAPTPVETAPLQPVPPAPAPTPYAPDSETTAEVAPDAPADTREAREALIARVPVAREMTTGMGLSFDVQPKDLAERIVVRFDRIVIGRASDWNAKKRDGRAYAIAEPGLHILTFLLDGADVHRIRIDARAGTPSPTTIAINLPQFGKHGRRDG